MTAQSRTFRIFVSSTFSDLKEERNALQHKVFPELRKLCMQYGARFQTIDLRWGVSEEASLDQQTMNICLGEIERCQEVTPRPNFIVLLGDRYGWCPPPPQIPAAEFEAILTLVDDPGDSELLLEWYARDENAVPPEYYLRPLSGSMTVYENWEPVEKRLQHTLEEAARKLELPPDSLVKYTTSATEQEIMKGAMQTLDAHDHVFSFFRSIEGLPDDKSAREFIDLNKEGRRNPFSTTRLRDLKNRLKDKMPENVHQYQANWQEEEAGITLDHLDQLCKDVYHCLSEVILDEIQRPLVLTPALARTDHLLPHDALDEEGLAHHRFVEERLHVFVGRTDTLGTIKNYITTTARTPLVILGEGGTGKSSLMAKAIEQAHADHPKASKAQVVYRFIGTTPESSAAQSLLESLCRELSRRYGAGDEEIPSDYHKLVTEFITWISKATVTRPLILYLDALDQLSTRQRIRSLAWIPDPLPENVWIVLSTRPGDIQQVLAQRGARMVTLKAMSPHEGGKLLEAWLEAANRTLQEPQRIAVLEKFRQSQGRPLFLKLAFEEVSRWKSGSGEPPEELTPGITGIIQHNMFARLAKEDNHGEALVSHALGYLAASRYGLAEDELLDLLSRDTEVYAWFLRGAYHYPQDVVTAAQEYRRGLDIYPSVGDGVSDRGDEDEARTWLDELRTRDQELDDFLAEVLPKDGGPCLPVVLWSRLYFDLQPFLSNSQAEGSSVLVFFHGELGEVASKQYLADGKEMPYHQKMAGYFQAKADPSGDRSWDGNDPRGLSELPYHLTKGGRWDEVRDTLTDFGFLQAKTEALGPQPLIDDYEETRRCGYQDTSLRDIQGALLLSAHVLADDRSQVAGQLTGRLLDSELGPIRALLDQARGWEQPWYRPLTASLIQPGGPLLRTLTGHSAPIKGIAFAADGQRIVSSSGDGTVHTWDLESGEILRVITNAVEAEKVWRDAEEHGLLDEDPNRRWGINLAHDIVELQEEGGEGRTLKFLGHNHEVKTFAFSPDGTKLATGGDDHTVRIWALETSSGETSFERAMGMTTAAVTQDGARGLSGHLDGKLRLWDMQTGVALRTLTGHGDRVNAMAVTADGQRAVSASSDATLRVWDLDSGAELLTLSGHKDRVLSLAITKDGQRAVSASADKTLKAWDLASGIELSSVEGPQSWEPALAIAPDGQMAAAGYQDRTLRVWDLNSSALLATCIGHINRINAVAFSPDGKRIASGGDDQTIRIWNTATGIERATLLGHWDSVRALDFSDNDRLVSISRDDTVRVWDLDTGEEVHCLGGRVVVDPARLSQATATPRTGATPNEPIGLNTTADGKRAVSFYINDDTLRLWDLERGGEIVTFTGDFVLACCAVTGDGSILAGTRNGQVHLLRLEGTYEAPISPSPAEEIKTKVDTSEVQTGWRTEPAGIEKLALVASGAIGEENLQNCSVYQLVHPPTERLARYGTVSMHGRLTCACGYEFPLTATIGFGGFLDGQSKHFEICKCKRQMMLVGETTESDAGEVYWLLLIPTTGPSGSVIMPGTASGLPELKINKIEKIASEVADPS